MFPVFQQHFHLVPFILNAVEVSETIIQYKIYSCSHVNVYNIELSDKTKQWQK